MQHSRFLAFVIASVLLLGLVSSPRLTSAGEDEATDRVVEFSLQPIPGAWSVHFEKTMLSRVRRRARGDEPGWHVTKVHQDGSVDSGAMGVNWIDGIDSKFNAQLSIFENGGLLYRADSERPVDPTPPGWLTKGRVRIGETITVTGAPALALISAALPMGKLTQSAMLDVTLAGLDQKTKTATFTVSGRARDYTLPGMRYVNEAARTAEITGMILRRIDLPIDSEVRLAAKGDLAGSSLVNGSDVYYAYAWTEAGMLKRRFTKNSLRIDGTHPAAGRYEQIRGGEHIGAIIDVMKIGERLAAFVVQPPRYKKDTLWSRGRFIAFWDPLPNGTTGAASVALRRNPLQEAGDANPHFDTGGRVGVTQVGELTLQDSEGYACNWKRVSAPDVGPLHAWMSRGPSSERDQSAALTEDARHELCVATLRRELRKAGKGQQLHKIHDLRVTKGTASTATIEVTYSWLRRPGDTYPSGVYRGHLMAKRKGSGWVAKTGTRSILSAEQASKYIKKTQDQHEKENLESTVRRLVYAYYGDRPEGRGVGTTPRRLSIEMISPTRIRAHCAWQYYTRRPRTSGWSSRVFDLEKRGRSWVVVSMGPNDSAKSAEWVARANRSHASSDTPRRSDTPRLVDTPAPQALIRRLCVRYYDTEGTWAGKYRLAHVHRIYIERVSKNEVRAHVKYRSVQVGGRGSAEDARVFRLWHDGTSWAVNRMGGQYSARFPR